MSDSDRSQDSFAIKVVDRRRFTPEGEARADRAHVEDAPRRPPPPPPAETRAGADARGGRGARQPSDPAAQAGDGALADDPTGSEAEAGDSGDGGVDFLGFIASLATQALASLGALPEARARGIPVNPQMAREYIDVLVMLHHRTRGNLSAEEEASFKRLLGDLQLHYVQATQGPPPAMPGHSPGRPPGR